MFAHCCLLLAAEPSRRQPMRAWLTFMGHMACRYVHIEITAL
jgi:hypothetical protein